MAADGAVETEVPVWRDKKRYLWLLGLIPPTAMSWRSRCLGVQSVGLEAVAPVWWGIGPLLVYVLL
ncbi:alkane 1-monooxygenase, partial [Rhodococcus hoagii]|nr:alkane 1-monooxygenase [Prescottella equi]